MREIPTRKKVVRVRAWKNIPTRKKEVRDIPTRKKVVRDIPTCKKVVRYSYMQESSARK